MLDAFSRGENDAACDFHIRLLPLIRALFAVTSPIPVKAAMRKFGFDAGSCRSPLCELTGDQERALAMAIAPWIAAEAKPKAAV
jgi:4-hydroxy-tetrahydrodipicolinate synthase